MLDDLRNSSAYMEEEPVPEQAPSPRRSQKKAQKETFLGMTASQRFIISLLLFMMVCILGTFALIFTGSIVLPF